MRDTPSIKCKTVHIDIDTDGMAICNVVRCTMYIVNFTIYNYIV